MPKAEPPFLSLLDNYIRSKLTDLAHWPSRPHLLFRSDTSEPLTSRALRVRRLYHAANFVRNPGYFPRYVGALVSLSFEEKPQPSTHIIEAMANLLGDLALENEIIFKLPDTNRPLTLSEERQLTERLIELEYRLVNEKRIFDWFGCCASAILLSLINEHIPQFALEAETGNTRVPLYALMPDLPRFVGTILGGFLSDFVPDGEASAEITFCVTRNRLFDNLLTASRLTREEMLKRPYKAISPLQSGLEPERLVSAYLGGTPLAELCMFPVPFEFTEEARREHQAIYGAPGAGKTQALQHFILQDLLKPNPPSLVIIDSHGEMLPKIEELALFNPDDGPLKDRLIIVDPEDEWVPALNMFDITTHRLSTYTAKQQETIEAGIIDLYDYLFGAIASELTSKQGTAFAYIVKAMTAAPNASVLTLLELMEDPARSVEQSKFRAVIERLDPVAQGFFRNQFYTSAYNPTKSQVCRRLYTILAVPAFVKMFSAPKNKLDLFDAMQSGKIVLVNTSQKLLRKASPVFGRYIIALTLAAAYERVAIADKDRHPAYLVLDEAHQYFDEKTETILTETRKYKVGLCYATQFLEQMDHRFRAAAATNTSIKLASGVSDKNARELAPDMGTTPDFIKAMRKSASGADWACYVRNVTPGAIKLTIPFGTLEQQKQMTKGQHQRLRQLNRETYGTPPESWRPEQYKEDKPAAYWQKLNEMALKDPSAPIEKPAFKVGDWVQVTLNGADQYKDGARIRNIHQQNGQWWVSVEGSDSGIPIENVRPFQPLEDDDPTRPDTDF